MTEMVSPSYGLFLVMAILKYQLTHTHTHGLKIIASQA
jgi:hypothetical protein